MFDLGAEVYVKPPSFKLWPTEGSFTALVDADLLPYIVGATTDETKWVAANYKVAQGEAKDIKETDECRDACDHLDWLVNFWITGSGADSARLYITESEDNFRLGTAFTKPYKGQRPPEKPPFFYELRAHLRDNHNAIVAKECEADDLIVSELHSRNLELLSEGAEIGSPEHRKFSDCIAVSSDKDIRISPGWHYDPTKADKVWVDELGWLDPVYKIKEVTDYVHVHLCKVHGVHHEECKGKGPCFPSYFQRGAKAGQPKTKRVKNGTKSTQSMYKLRGAGLKFFYSQILVGDSADNYPGLPDCGITRTFEVLNSCKSEEELYANVLEEYRRKYGESSIAHNYRGGFCELTPEQFMAEQGRLAWLRRYPDERWAPSIDIPAGDDPAAWQGGE